MEDFEDSGPGHPAGLKRLSVPLYKTGPAPGPRPLFRSLPTMNAPSTALALLQRAADHGRLAHAYLLSGTAGRAVACALAARILGVSESELGRHPDAHFVQPESKSRRIVIEQIRRLEHVLHQKALSGPRKVGILLDADRLQPEAANAFLKTLEEPPEGTHLLLATTQPEMLLDTVISRCISVPARDSAEVALNREILDALAPLCQHLPEVSLADCFRFTRRFQAVLNTIRDTIRKEAEAEFGAEKKRVRETADPEWLNRQEELAKARAEAGALRERGVLLQTVAAVIVAALREKTGAPGPTPPGIREPARQLADRIALPRLLAMIAAIDGLGNTLQRNVNEALALEAGFLEVFSASSD